MSPRTIRTRFRDGGFPRVSGDEPDEVTGEYLASLFSPRERG